MSWRVERARGTAAAFHARDLPPEPARRVWVQEVEAPALVLGSTQDPATVDEAEARAEGIAVVRRRSGGGAVLVEPGGVLWVDVVVPPTDPLWDDDVGRAAHWVGEAWAAALGGGAEVHRGGLVPSPWSRVVCFAGLGPGEVTVAGRKVVGVAQRRTRHGARFQCAALLRWEPERLVPLLAVAPGERAAVVAELAGRAAPAGVGGEALLSAFLASLPTAP